MEQRSIQTNNLPAALCVSGILAAAILLLIFQVNEFTLSLLVLYLPVQFLIAYGVYKGKIGIKAVQIITLVYLLISLFTIFPAIIYCGAFIYASNNRRQ
jgi:hypothetical protein